MSSSDPYDTPPPPLPPAGWYPDPEHPGGRRYWNGRDWTDDRHPAAGEPTLVAPKKRTWTVALAVGAAIGVVVLGLAIVATRDGDTTYVSPQSTATEVAATAVRPRWMEECLDIFATSSKPTIRRNAVTICGCAYDDHISRVGGVSGDITEDAILAALDICSKPYQ